MLHIAIVEDDERDRCELRSCLQRYGKETGQTFQITEFSDGTDIITDYTAAYDLILLDVEMVFLNGIKTAEKIRELDPDTAIIFITNSPQYAIQGYRVRALDYVLKPISFFSFSECMTRALRFTKKKEKEYITIAMKGGKMKLDLSQLCYIEVQDHLLIYHTTEGNYVTKGAIWEAEGQLDPSRFFRCNRCYLVSLEHVDSYHGNDVTVNGDTIQVSRSRRKPFLDALNEYMNGVMK